jgi:hypothetical protein
MPAGPHCSLDSLEIFFYKPVTLKMLQGCWEECQSDAECWDWTRHNIKARQSSFFSLSAKIELFSLETYSQIRVRFLCEMREIYLEYTQENVLFCSQFLF